MVGASDTGEKWGKALVLSLFQDSDKGLETLGGAAGALSYPLDLGDDQHVKRSRMGRDGAWGLDVVVIRCPG